MTSSLSLLREPRSLPAGLPTKLEAGDVLEAPGAPPAVMCVSVSLDGSAAAVGSRGCRSALSGSGGRPNVEVRRAFHPCIAHG